MSITIDTITINNARLGTANQVAKGIHGVFAVDMLLEDGTIFLSCKELTLRQTRNGKWYVAPPFRMWDGRDGQKNRTYYYFFYPTSQDRDDRMSGLLDKVLKELGINPNDPIQASVNEGTAPANTENPKSNKTPNSLF